VRAFGEIAVKAAKGKLPPSATAILLNEIQEIITVADAERRAAAASRAERLQRKKESAK
jgi:hypothetical protein